MTKEQWQSLHDKLKEINSTFSSAYYNYKNGRNEKLRKEASREVDHAIFLAKFYIEQHQEAFELLTGGPDVDSWTRTVKYDEFKQARWFVRDLPRFLEETKKKICSFEDEAKGL